jgi:hypothetical protein
MSRHRFLWWTLLASFVVGTGLRMASGLEANNQAVILPVLAYTVVGAVVASRRPENPIGWVFLGVGGLTGFGSMAEVASSTGVGDSAPPWWAVAGAGVASWYWYPLLALMTTFTVLLYPSGLTSPRWRPVLWLAVASTAGVVVMSILQPTLCLGDTSGDCTPERTVANPWSPGFMAGAGDVEDSAVFALVGLVFLLCGLAAVVSAFVRSRRAVGIERQQMRWFAFAVALLPAELVLEALFPSFSDSRLGDVAFAVLVTLVPVSCGIAILRYRLYEIDRIISRTTSYAVVTGVVVVVYVVVVATVSQVLPAASDGLAVAAATLAAAAAFRPLLSRVRSAVDRRFNRSRYDALRVVGSFGDRLQEEITTEAVATELMTTVDVALAPGVAGLWLRQPSS